MATNPNNVFYVYLHRRADTREVFYVGKGKGRRAWREHGRSVHWRRIATKHGFLIEVVAADLSEHEAFDLEVATIAAHPNLCNHTTGGEGISGYSHTDATRARLHEAHAGRPHKPEHIEKRAAKLRGKKRTPEFGQQVTARQLGRIASDETRQKMSASHAGKTRSPEATAKTAAWHTGKTRSDEARANMKVAQPKRKVVCADGEFESLTAAAEWLRANGWPNATKTGVWHAATGRYAQAYGRQWSYA